MLWFVFACACAAALAEQPAESPALMVTIDQGPVRGYKHPDYDVFVFRSIPYATAPTGRDRYKAPLPPRNWTEPFEAVAQGIRCPQGTAIGANEDCLITNVYVPNTPKTNLPVMVTVHGGAFQIGAGDDEPQANLVNTKKMIVVNFNYRLGVHGFLCLGNEEAPGNAGMKDQVALLRWVQRNIAAFGGNPSDVTLCGCSAGGASVDILRLSSSTSGLFSKAIVGSGGNAGSFGIQNDPLKNAREYARMLNFEDGDDLAALTEFYTNSSLETVFSRFYLAFNRPDSTVLWAPCVENDLGIERFLEEAPVTILKKGEHSQVPILYGFAEHEGMTRIPLFQNWKTMMNDQFSDFLPGDLAFSSVEEKEQVAKRVKEFYFGNETVHEGNILRYIDLFTDMMFGYTMLRSVKLNAEYGSSTMYLYEFSYADENSPMIPHANIRGAPHCIQFVMFGDQNETAITPEGRHVMRAMRKMVLDFVTTGNPVPENLPNSVWPAANATRAPHMNLNYQAELRGPLNQERAELWDSIYEAHYRTPTPPGTPGTDEDDGDDTGNRASVLPISILSIVYAIVLILIY